MQKYQISGVSLLAGDMKKETKALLDEQNNYFLGYYECHIPMQQQQLGKDLSSRFKSAWFRSGQE